jgi:aspartyl-tRNA(Asn)/glutamyl-tRNA(Gln) amidotransferase subunit A
MVEMNGQQVRVLRLMNRFTRPWNVTGSPAVATPCGFSAGGLPLSFQIAGRDFDEASILRVAHAYESATDWHKRRPEL